MAVYFVEAPEMEEVKPEVAQVSPKEDVPKESAEEVSRDYNPAAFVSGVDDRWSW